MSSHPLHHTRSKTRASARRCPDALAEIRCEHAVHIDPGPRRPRAAGSNPNSEMHPVDVDEEQRFVAASSAFSHEIPCPAAPVRGPFASLSRPRSGQERDPVVPMTGVKVGTAILTRHGALDPHFMTLQIGILLAFLCAVRLEPRVLLQAPRRLRGARRSSIRHPLRSAEGAVDARSGSRSACSSVSAPGRCTSRRSRSPRCRSSRSSSPAASSLIAVMADRMFGFRSGAGSGGASASPPRAWSCSASRCRAPDGAHASFSSPAMIAFEAVLLGVGGLLILGPRAGAPAEHHGVMLAAAAGILFGVCNVAVKALTRHRRRRTASSASSAPGCSSRLVASAAAFYASARSLQDGEAVEVIAITGTAANICRHRRRHHRLRRPDARHRARHRRPGARLRAGRSSPRRSRRRRCRSAERAAAAA